MQSLLAKIPSIIWNTTTSS